MSTARKSRGVGKKSRNSEVKIEILKFLADGKHSGVEIDYHLTDIFGIGEKRGMRKHRHDLYQSEKFLERKEIGMDAIWWLKDDLNSYIKTVRYIVKYEKNVDWNVEEFTHKTKYGQEHFNELLDWWIDKKYKMYCEKWNKTEGNMIRDKKLLFIVTISEREHLLRMLEMSPKLLMYFLNVENTNYEDPNLTRDRIIESVMSNVISNNPLIHSELFAANVSPVKSYRRKEYRDGIRIKMDYNLYPKLESKKEKVK